MEKNSLITNYYYNIFHVPSINMVNLCRDHGKIFQDMAKRIESSSVYDDEVC